MNLMKCFLIQKTSSEQYPANFLSNTFRCDFAVKQADCTVYDEVAGVLKSFHEAKKPIG